MNKIFPIQQSPTCLLKWSFSTIYLNNGTSNSCHRCVPNIIPIDNFNSFHNLPEKITARKKMLAGEWPGFGCEYCKNSEEAGGVSDRILQLEKLEDKNLVAPELWKNNQATQITPTMLEIYFKNTCNMKCMYCRPDQSSQWEQELRKYGPMQTRSFSIPSLTSRQDYEKRKLDLWSWLEKHYKILRRFHILGGEPFLLDETEECLDFWESHPNSRLVFAMFTNANVEVTRFEHLLKKMQNLVETNKVLKFQITASLDCLGDEAEYVRYGLNLNTFKTNFEKLVGLSWLDLSVNSAVTALTIKTMPDLIYYLDECDQKRLAMGASTIDRSFNLSCVSGSPNQTYDHPTNFGPQIFDNDFNLIIEALEKSFIKRPLEISHIKTMRQQISSYKFNYAAVQGLKKYLDELDRRRGTNWKKVFGWLDDLE